ncbi:ABC transporter substrate-binding protein [Spirochaeta isovalerica]|uniref:Probable sugar-binding periplasmic protein n=1 Tax=Spirochaeta isovalerica TaxID=150 RepID=A0A841RH69_9SPIO|nr:ABC transporter substrate-binding protein [Spirochaeta isovalerica]MBB6482129.1 raffinose/stachyose/melibiose transport system substrate-binding protein [Spirochaeta isovalerica]
MKKTKTMFISIVLGLLAATVCMASGNQDAESGGKDVRKVELKVFMSFPRFQEQFEAYFEQFKAKELAEKNIDVNIKLEMPNADQAGQILKTRFASGDAPDIYTLHAIADIPTFYKAGYMEDLSEMDFAGELFDGVKNTVSKDGKVLALPLESLSWGYLYNKDIFNKLGLTPPRTVSEMEKVTAALQTAGVTPFVLAFQESWIPQLMMALSLGGVVSSDVTDFVERMNSGSASYEEVRQVFEIIDVIMANGTENPFEVGSMAGSTSFAKGEAAMWVQGPWMAESILEVNPDMNFGVAPLPVSEDRNSAMINLATSTSLALSPECENKDVAEDLMNYILDKEDSAALFEELKFNPVTSYHDYEIFPWIEEALSYVAEGYAYLDLSLPGAVTDETAQLLQSYYLKEVSQDEIIERLDKTWAKAVK